VRFRPTSLIGLLLGVATAPAVRPQPAPLPNIIYPDPLPDDPGARKPGTAMGGTGFFIASRLINPPRQRNCLPPTHT
jgi:hypothetical protein